MKTLAWRAGLVSAAGVTLLAIFGAAGRAPTPYDGAFMPARDETNLRAYAEPVLAVAQLTGFSKEEQVKDTLQIWLDHYDRGKLFSVAPSHLDDLGDKGARGEILRSRKHLSSTVQAIALRLEETDPSASAAWYGDLITLNDIFKFSTPNTMTDSTYYQHAALKGLERLAPRLSDEDRTVAKAKVESMIRPSEPLGPFALRINLAYRRTETESVHGGSVISRALRDLSSTTPEIVEAKGSKFSAIANQEEMLKIISTTMYMALRAEQRIREQATEVAASLD